MNTLKFVVIISTSVKIQKWVLILLQGTVLRNEDAALTSFPKKEMENLLHYLIGLKV